jgi:hypothetical protein
VYLYVVETCSAGATSVVSSEFRKSSAWIASVDVEKALGSRACPGRPGWTEAIVRTSSVWRSIRFLSVVDVKEREDCIYIQLEWNSVVEMPKNMDATEAVRPTNDQSPHYSVPKGLAPREACSASALAAMCLLPVCPWPVARCPLPVARSARRSPAIDHRWRGSLMGQSGNDGRT